MKVTMEERYFKDRDEWDYFLSQLNIPEKKRYAVDEITLDVVDFQAIDIDSNPLTL